MQLAPGQVPCAVAAALSSALLRGFAARPAVTTNTIVRDLNAPVDRLDDRRIEVIFLVIANGLPLWNGAVDTTIVSPLTRDAVPRSRRDLARPVALLDARRQKERTYPELLWSSGCRLVVLGVEVGGRWSSETADFLRQLARAKARDTPATLRVAYQAALVHRWSGFLTAATMQAFAASLSALPSLAFFAWAALRPLAVTCLPTAPAPFLRCSPAGFPRTLSLASRVGRP